MRDGRVSWPIPDGAVDLSLLLHNDAPCGRHSSARFGRLSRDVSASGRLMVIFLFFPPQSFVRYYAGKEVGQAFQPDRTGVRLESLTYVCFFLAGVIVRRPWKGIGELKRAELAAVTVPPAVTRTARGAYGRPDPLWRPTRSILTFRQVPRRPFKGRRPLSRPGRPGSGAVSPPCAADLRWSSRLPGADARARMKSVAVVFLLHHSVTMSAASLTNFAKPTTGENRKPGPTPRSRPEEIIRQGLGHAYTKYPFDPAMMEQFKPADAQRRRSEDCGDTPSDRLDPRQLRGG